MTEKKDPTVGGEDAWVRDLLGALPEPSMPADVSIRIQQAIAAEQGMTLGDELAARRERMKRWRGAPAWAAGAAAAAAVVAAFVVPSVVGDNTDRDQNVAGTESAVAPLLAESNDAAGATKRAAIPGTISGSQFSASSLPQDVRQLLASVGAQQSLAISAPTSDSADDTAVSSGPGAGTDLNPGSDAGAPGQTEPVGPTGAPEPNTAPPVPSSGGGSAPSSGGSTGSAGDNSSSEVLTGPADGAGSSGFSGSAPQGSQAPLDESCLVVIAGGGSVVATDFGYWQNEPAYLIVVDDPRYPDTYTAFVVSPDCNGKDLHTLYEEKVPRT